MRLIDADQLLKSQIPENKDAKFHCVSVDTIKAFPDADISEWDLRKLALKLGYRIVPYKKREKLLSCICGSNRREHWYGPNYEALVCKKCSLEVKGRTQEEARRNWNKMIRGYKEKQ